MDILRIVALVFIAAGLVWLTLREFEREHQRQELAKKNMSFIESLNLTGLPIITFRNNGNPVNMVLDTGSNVCIINYAVLPELQHEVIEDLNSGVIGLGGEKEQGKVVCVPLHYKDWEFDFDCWAMDMSDTVNSMKQEYGVTIHGILGTGFFTKYKYVLDFNEMVAYSLRRD